MVRQIFIGSNLISIYAIVGVVCRGFTFCFVVHNFCFLDFLNPIVFSGLPCLCLLRSDVWIGACANRNSCPAQEFISVESRSRLDFNSNIYFKSIFPVVIENVSLKRPCSIILEPTNMRRSRSLGFHIRCP